MTTKLAMEGGEPAVKGLPKRHLFGADEKAAAAAVFEDCMASGDAFMYQGVEETAYGAEFAAYMGGGFADGVNSGTSAVYVALRAVRPPAFSEVLCGPVSDPGGIMPIALAGCIPIPVDAAPGSFNPDPQSIAERITERTSAIVVAHIAGIPADMESIMQLARGRGIKVVEDCAQAHGAVCRGRKVGAWGDVAAFSTMSGKHHATGGQGGVVFTQDEETYWWARRFADRGKPFHAAGAKGNMVASLNLNLDDLSAAIGRVQLRKLDDVISRRRRHARWLIDNCRRKLEAVDFVDAADGSEAVHWFLLGQLRLDRLRVDKHAFVSALQAEGVPCNVSYLHLFTDQDWYRRRCVLEGTRWPWDSPRYTGDATREYPVPNIRETDTYTFQLPWHEGYDEAAVQDIFNALEKVEAAYRR